MTEYNTGEWVTVNDVGELRHALKMFPDALACEIELRFLETIDESNDRKSDLSIQFKSTEIDAW